MCSSDLGAPPQRSALPDHGCLKCLLSELRAARAQFEVDQDGDAYQVRLLDLEERSGVVEDAGVGNGNGALLDGGGDAHARRLWSRVRRALRRLRGFLSRNRGMVLAGAQVTAAIIGIIAKSIA